LNTFQCLTCTTGYVWTGSTCILCSIPSCSVATYTAGSCSCTQCATNYIRNGAGGCSLCSSYITNCMECSSQNVCTFCDATNQFYVNETDNKCSKCNIIGCSLCKSLTTCLSCDILNNY
jgi:hypothetical protein